MHKYSGTDWDKLEEQNRSQEGLVRFGKASLRKSSEEAEPGRECSQGRKTMTSLR